MPCNFVTQIALLFMHLSHSYLCLLHYIIYLCELSRDQAFS